MTDEITDPGPHAHAWVLYDNGEQCSVCGEMREVDPDVDVEDIVLDDGDADEPLTQLPEYDFEGGGSGG